MSETKFTISEDKKTLTAERTFDAPKARVWEAYSNPDLLKRWFSPKGWETEIKHMEFKSGGYWHYGMKCIDEAQTDWFGKYSWGKASYDQISAPDSIVYTDIFCDENGTPTPNMPTSKTTVTFVEKDGKTTVSSKTEYANAEALEMVLKMGMQEGFAMTWDKLADVVQGRQ